MSKDDSGYERFCDEVYNDKTVALFRQTYLVALAAALRSGDPDEVKRVHSVIGKNYREVFRTRFMDSVPEPDSYSLANSSKCLAFASHSSGPE